RRKAQDGGRDLWGVAPPWYLPFGRSRQLPRRAPDRPAREGDLAGFGNRGAVKQGKRRVTTPAKILQLRCGDRRGARHFDREGIPMPSVLQELIVKVRSRGEAGRPNPPDDLALLHPRAGPDVRRDGAQVRVARADLPGVA